MAAVNVKPLPPKGSYSVGGYTEFLAQLDIFVDHLLENSISEDSHDASSDSEEVDNVFDPAVHTVDEFRAAIVAMRASISEIL